jgi:hypothetical protein
MEMSRAAAALRDAQTSECPHCKRMTKTTSDGICADCWGSKGGRPMQWQPQPFRLGLFDDVFDFLPFGLRH